MANVSRRKLLEGSIGAGLAGLALPAVAVPANKPRHWDATYDVVILGAGGAGLSAACAAREQNLKTIVLEKNGFPGGSSLICTSMYAVAGTDFQKEHNVTKDSEALFESDMMKLGENFNDPAVVHAFVHASKVQYDWMQKVGLKPRELAVGAGMSQPRGHVFTAQKVIETMYGYAGKHGAAFRFNMPAKHLVWDADTHRVVGVIAAGKDGKEHAYQAKRGVIIATGGFARSPKVLKKFNPYLTNCDVLSASGSTGDGLLMALELGADFRDTAFIKATYGSKPGLTSVTESTTIYYSGAIIVNKAGQRFVDESQTYMTLSDAALKQPKGASYIVFDSNILNAAMKEPQGRELFEMIPKGKIPSYVFAGNTLEEAASKAGIDPKALTATVNKYNRDVDKGADSEFGRKSLASGIGKLVRVEKGPFYIFPSSSVLFGTYCGIRINPKAQVVDVFDKVIPGLYAAGETTGGIHGSNYMSGSGYAKALSFGRLAATSIAASK